MSMVYHSTILLQLYTTILPYDHLISACCSDMQPFPSKYEFTNRRWSLSVLNISQADSTGCIQIL